MRAQAAGAGANRNGGDRGKFDQIDGGDGAVGGVANIGEQVQAGTQPRRTQFEGDFADGESAEQKQQKDQAKIEAQFHCGHVAIWR